MVQRWERGILRKWIRFPCGAIVIERACSGRNEEEVIGADGHEFPAMRPMRPEIAIHAANKNAEVHMRSL